MRILIIETRLRKVELVRDINRAASWDIVNTTHWGSVPVEHRCGTHVSSAAAARAFNALKD